MPTLPEGFRSRAKKRVKLTKDYSCFTRGVLFAELHRVVDICICQLTMDPNQRRWGRRKGRNVEDGLRLFLLVRRVTWTVGKWGSWRHKQTQSVRRELWHDTAKTSRCDPVTRSNMFQWLFLKRKLYKNFPHWVSYSGKKSSKKLFKHGALWDFLIKANAQFHEISNF